MCLSYHNPSSTRLLNQLHRCNIENFLLSHGFELVALLRILGVGNQLVGITDSCDSCSGFGGCARTLPVRGMRQLDHLLPFRAVPGAGVPESLREVVRVPGFLLQQQHPSSLIVTDVDELQDFSSCHIPTNNISKHVDPFSISAVNQNLIFYNCTKAPATIDSGLVQTRCGNNTFVRVGGPYGYNESGSYFIEGCDAITMPVLGDPAKTDASRYQELMSGGFLLTWQQPTSVGKFTNSPVKLK